MGYSAVERRIHDFSVSDEEFLQSRVVKRHLHDIFYYPCYQMCRPVPSWNIFSDAAGAEAFTDGQVIYVNLAGRFISEQKTREMKLVMEQGLSVHEWGHYRFTDFVILKDTMEAAEKCVPYPEIPPHYRENPLVQDMMSFLRAPERKGTAIATVLKDIINILEDGYIEEGCFRVLSGDLSDSLYLVREFQWDTTPELVKLIEQEEKGIVTKYDVMSALLLEYSKFGKFKYNVENETEKAVVQQLADTLPVVDDVLYADDPMERARLFNLVFALLGDIVKDEVLRIEESTSDGESGDGEAGESHGGRGNNSSAAPKGSGRAVRIKPGESSGRSGSAKARRKTKEEASAPDDATASAGSSADTLDGGGKPAPDKGEGDVPDKADSGEDESDSASASPADTGEDECGPEDAASPEEDSADRAEKESDSDSSSDEESSHPEFSDDTDGRESDSEAADYTPDRPDMAGELSRLTARLDKEIRTELAEEAIEDEHAKALSDELKKCKLSGMHRKSDRILRREKKVSDEVKEDPDTAALIRKYQEVADIMAKQLEPYLKKQKELELPLSGCFTGTRFDATRLIQNDWRYFKQNICPTPLRGVAITVLVDESGSMRSSGRIEMAKDTALVLYLFCKRLGIPCSVIGHTAPFGNEDVIINSYADFDTQDKDDIYRILGVQAYEDNRDGAAISFAGEQLLKRKEAIKLMVIISDGAPCATNYMGPAAEDEMRSIVRELRRNKVTVFAAAIGSDKGRIQRIFEEGFLDISNLAALPGEMLGLVRRYIR